MFYKNRKPNWYAVIAFFIFLLVGFSILTVSRGGQSDYLPPKNGFTGAVVFSPDPEEFIVMETFANLRELTPIINENFTIDFDYGLNKFIVRLVDEVRFSREDFFNWVDVNGYGVVQNDKFVFKN